MLLLQKVESFPCFLGLEGDRNGRDRVLPSNSSELGWVTRSLEESDQQGEGWEKVAAVTLNLGRASKPNQRCSRRSRWAERGGCTHALASDHQQ